MCHYPCSPPVGGQHISAKVPAQVSAGAGAAFGLVGVTESAGALRENLGGCNNKEGKDIAHRQGGGGAGPYLAFYDVVGHGCCSADAAAPVRCNKNHS